MQGYTAAEAKALTARQVVVEYGADLLDDEDQVVGDLTPDLAGGTVARSNYAAVHGTVDLTLHRALDWGTARVRPWQTVDRGRDDGPPKPRRLRPHDPGPGGHRRGHRDLRGPGPRQTPPTPARARGHLRRPGRDLLPRRGPPGDHGRGRDRPPGPVRRDRPGHDHDRPAGVATRPLRPRDLAPGRERPPGRDRLSGPVGGPGRPIPVRALPVPGRPARRVDPRPGRPPDQHRRPRPDPDHGHVRPGDLVAIRPGRPRRPARRGGGPLHRGPPGRRPRAASSRHRSGPPTRPPSLAIGNQEIDQAERRTRTLEIETGPLPVLGHFDVARIEDPALGSLKVLTRSHEIPLDGGDVSLTLEVL